MSLRSGVFTKYVVEFVDAKLTVSNDPSVADLAIDADVTVTMARGSMGTTFTITLYDLPLKTEKLLHDALKSKAYQAVKIHLGYFETNVQPVMEGIYEKVEKKTGADKSLGQDKLVTTITGTEAALKACKEAKFTGSLYAIAHAFIPALLFSYEDAANSVLSTVSSNPDFHSLVNKKVVINAPLKQGESPTKLSNGTVLTALGEIAKKADAELLVVDKTVFLGSPIARPNRAPQLDPSVNLAAIDPSTVMITPKLNGADKSKPPNQVKVDFFNFTALGDPTMRPGQTLKVTGVEGFTGTPEYRIRNVKHQFSASTGYVCVGAAATVQKDGANSTEIDSKINQNAATGAQDVASMIKSEAAKNPIVELTSVKRAADAYQADLYYGAPATGEDQPSINTAVTQADDHVYEGKPIASPFAWRKCGLVTPVYPGMKALVAHNVGLATDGIVTGYIWSKQPDFPPPDNLAGDWWLCLPIFDSDPTQPPADSTKAANDLTAKNGCRVIELKGLKITVGAAGLREIGKRPPDPEDAKVAEACTIAIASGPVVTLKKGEIDVQINADGSGPKLTLSSSGITLTDGTLNVQLANGKLAIG